MTIIAEIDGFLAESQIDEGYVTVIGLTVSDRRKAKSTFEQLRIDYNLDKLPVFEEMFPTSQNVDVSMTTIDHINSFFSAFAEQYSDVIRDVANEVGEIQCPSPQDHGWL